jgi:hypothetical protein
VLAGIVVFVTLIGGRAVLIYFLTRHENGGPGGGRGEALPDEE